MRSNTFPSPIPSLYVAYYNSSQQYIRNSFGPRQVTTATDSWQESTYLFRPVASEVYLKIKSTLMNFPVGSWVNNWFLNGSIDNIRIYKKSLTAQDMLEL